MSSIFLITFATFVQRCISGLVNKFGYEADSVSCFSASFFLIMSPIYFATLYENIWLQMAWIATAIIAVLKANVLLGEGKFQVVHDLHLWELLTTTSFLFAAILSGADIISAMLFVYPALFIHKAFINSAFKQGIWWNSTDDATGHTYNIPSLGIKVPRTTQKFRFFISIFCIGGLIAQWFFIKYFIQISDVYYFLIFLKTKFL